MRILGFIGITSALLALTPVFGSGGGDMDASHAKIRFYTGNLSVGYFMQYWGTGELLPTDVPTRKYCQDMKSVSVSAVTDYLGWCRIEPEQGKFDWSFYDNNQRILHDNGLKYSVFCWLHFPPKWFRESADFVPYRCAEHDEPIMQTSIWAPGTLKLYDHFYKELAAHFGDKIDFIRLATPSEYGEIGYPNGMTKWLVPQDHAHGGFWCNDKFARADFRTEMQKRHKTISALNSAWGTSFASFDAIEYPAMVKDRSKLVDPLRMSVGERRWILDFVDWYYGSQSSFVTKAVGVVRKYFPGKELIVSMGYGSQRTSYGNDDVGIAKLCRKLKVSCQTPGNVPYFAMKSLATPCHFAQVHYITEPPGGMSRNEEVNRIWSDASCGAQSYFDYPDNLLGAKDAFAKYNRFLDGKKAITDVALFFPTTDHRLRDQDWPVRTITGANVLREFIDYDLVDERLIRDGILKQYKVLVAYDGNIIDRATLPALEKWISDGGILLVRDFGSMETIEGDRSFYTRVFPQSSSAQGASINDLLASHTRKLGKGAVIVAASHADDYPEFARLASDLAFNLSHYFPGKTDVPRIDGEQDGVNSTLFADRILYLNFEDYAIDKAITLRASDFGERVDKLDRTLHLEPHSIEEIPLR